MRLSVYYFYYIEVDVCKRTETKREQIDLKRENAFERSREDPKG
jgi:hypothetical protein